MRERLTRKTTYPSGELGRWFGFRVIWVWIERNPGRAMPQFYRFDGGWGVFWLKLSVTGQR